jgi:hypothetical protein
MAAENVAITTVTMSGITVAFINWLKASPYMPWVTKEKVALLRALSVIGAALTSVGIAWVWNPDAHSLTITGLSLAAIGTFGYSALKSFVMQEIIYHSTKGSGTKTVTGQTYTPKRP